MLTIARKPAYSISVFALCLGTFVAGCTSDFRQHAGEHLDLSRILANDSVRKQVEDAERVQPSDQFKSGPRSRPGVRNVSKGGREAEAAHAILAEYVRPRLVRMSAPQLLQSLKTSSIEEESAFAGVAYYVFRDGNAAIISELHKRDAAQLASIRHFRDDRRRVFQGDSGGAVTIGEVVVDLMASHRIK